MCVHIHIHVHIKAELEAVSSQHKACPGVLKEHPKEHVIKALKQQVLQLKRAIVSCSPFSLLYRRRKPMSRPVFYSVSMYNNLQRHSPEEYTGGIILLLREWRNAVEESTGGILLLERRNAVEERHSSPDERR